MAGHETVSEATCFIDVPWSADSTCNKFLPSCKASGGVREELLVEQLPEQGPCPAARRCLLSAEAKGYGIEKQEQGSKRAVD